MKIISDSAWLKKTIIKTVGIPLMHQFNKASKNVKKSQESILKEIIERNNNTVFGKEYKFSTMQNIEDYKKKVPIQDFEGHRSYIDRMVKGEADVLFAGKPMSYNMTSGTTDKPKLIPVSKNYFRTYKTLNKLWFYSCLRDNPAIFNGKSLSAVSPSVESLTEDGTPIGSTSGSSFQAIPSILEKTYSSPYSVMCIKDYLKKYYALVRGALGGDVSYIVCASPSNVLRFHQTIKENFSDLVKDIHDGTIRPDVLAEIEKSQRNKMQMFYKPDPKRALLLEKLIKEHGENLKPKHYWPNVACVNTWKQGNFSRIIPEVKELFGEKTVIRAFGYQASEARAGLVFDNDWDYSALAVNIYHFEFIAEEDRGDPAARTYLAHELEVGQRYYIVISNNSGLYRYDINDLIEIVGFYNQTPLIRFIMKGEGITSITGEKLAETQVIQAVDDVAKSLDINIKFFNMFCDEEKFFYSLFVEFSQNTSRHNKDAFGFEFDIRLRDINPEYEAKRGSKRLDAPTIRELQPNSYNVFKETLIANRFAKDGQYKDSYLRKNRMFLELLEKMAI